MSRRKIRKSKILRWRLECLGHTVVERLASALPGTAVFRLGEMLGSLAWHMMRSRREIVLRNLRIAYAGELDYAEIQQLSRETFRRAGANLISATYTANLGPEQVREVVSVENMHLLEEAQARGKGVVLLLAHMGNWELLTKLIHVFPPGSKCGAFYRPLNNPLLDARVLARRQADGTRMFSKRDPFHEVTKFLRDGGIVGILADQRVGILGEVVPFFGRLTRATPLPGLLARRAKAEVLALSLITESPGRWKAVFHPVESPITTAHCMAALQVSMKSSPVDVFWLQDRWKVFVGVNHPVAQWLPQESIAGQKPHRALLWLAGVSPSWVLPEEWRHADVRYELAIDASAAIPEWLPTSARIHRITVGDMQKTIREIDAADPLPLDFLLAGPGAADLSEAAGRGQIRVVHLTERAGSMP